MLLLLLYFKEQNHIESLKNDEKEKMRKERIVVPGCQKNITGTKLDLRSNDVITDSCIKIKNWTSDL
jgi:hypothetical protein